MGLIVAQMLNGASQQKLNQGFVVGEKNLTAVAIRVGTGPKKIRNHKSQIFLVGSYIFTFHVVHKSFVAYTISAGGRVIAGKVPIAGIGGATLV